MRALITGVGGFAGRWLASELAGTGVQLYGLIRPGGSPPPEGVLPVVADLRDPAALVEAVRRADPDRVYHLAAISAGSAQDAHELLPINVEGTRSLLGAFRGLAHPVSVLLASTGLVYGECDPGRPATEESPIRPLGAYAASKWAMECRAREVCRPPVTLRLARAFNHTGPGQQPDFVVGAFASQIARAEASGGEAVLRVGDLSPRRDFLDVRDVVRAYRLIQERGEEGAVYNVASGAAYTAREILERLCALAAVPVRVEPDPERMRPADAQVSVGSAGRLRALAGWEPRYDLQRTLADTLDDGRARARKEHDGIRT